MKLTITRDTGWYAMLRKIKVLMDGKPIGEVRRNETRTFDVMRGMHTVSAKIDWVESERLALDFDTGDKRVLIGSRCRKMRDMLKLSRGNLMAGTAANGEPVIFVREMTE